MRKLVFIACALATFSLAANSSFADNIAGKLGVTGKIGVLIPADGDFGPFKNHTDAGFIGGGGLIYGIDKNFAAEIDITRSSVDSDFGAFGVTNLSLGGQYRFALSSQPKLVPYVGAGLDILFNDADQGLRVDNTVGVHASGGIDFFIMKQLALTAETKLVVAPDADIKGPSGKLGNFDPTSLSGTFGVRYFFN